jgi:hypothetical protein
VFGWLRRIVQNIKDYKADPGFADCVGPGDPDEAVAAAKKTFPAVKEPTPKKEK